MSTPLRGLNSTDISILYPDKKVRVEHPLKTEKSRWGGYLKPRSGV